VSNLNFSFEFESLSLESMSGNVGACDVAGLGAKVK
jgi:hypothetical protein